ncbi:Ca2+-binding EF-hand superfamily protein [Haloactinospora alba]|uniref:Ca2+-binding EF-hand superfamily protein n=1 Tax=Haloactinospora alba TaxID=405555 RepID=A0A543NEM8_9ACTN|nr:EF-hand domain-containing protein [Haloactinospora alba]TQN30297.1 Ca2+-binding EF-hand superfamily protein [Haloactinospora alba]
MANESDSRQQKIESDFKVLDSNGNGYIEANDVHRVFSSLLDEFGYESNSPKAQELDSNLEDLWSTIKSSVDSDGDGKVSKDEYITFWMNADESEIRSYTDAITNALFDMADTSGDGSISEQEFAKFAKAQGLKGDSHSVFQELDTNGNGSLSKQEFADLVSDIYSSESTGRESALVGM